MFEDIPNLLISIIALSIAIMSLLISLKTRRLNSSFTLSDGFNEINKLALLDEKNLLILDELYFPDLVSQDIATKRKRWAIFISLNVVEHAFIAKRHKAIDAAVAEPIIENLLHYLLQSDEVKKTLHRGYWDKDFKKHAFKMIDKTHNIYMASNVNWQ